MPARPPVSSVVMVEMVAKLGDDIDVVNRFFQKYSGTPGALVDSDCVNWATAVNAAWAAHIRSFQTADYTLVETVVTDLTSDLGATGSEPSGGAGTAAGPGLSASACVVIKCQIARRYRGGHPRQYLCGFPHSSLTDPQTWDPTFLGNLETAYIAFRTALATAPPTALQPASDVNVSYFQGFTNHTFPSGRVRPIPNLRSVPVVDPIATFGANPKVGSQRRRNLQSA